MNATRNCTRVISRLAIPVLLIALNEQSHASHALVPIGFGASSNAMAGTDIAFSSTPTGINNNPAGIAQTPKTIVEFGIEPHIINSIRHKDSLGNDKRSVHSSAYLFSGGWISNPSENRQLKLGIGLFAQGGAGYRYKNLLTDFGTKDNASAILGVVRVAPAIAYRINKNIRVGLSTSINYMEAAQEVFPGTSNAQAGFFGVRISDLSGTSYSWKAGIQLALNEKLTLGAAYSARTDLNLRNGHATVNFTSIGKGRIRYGNAEIDGMSLPEEIGIGLAWQPTPNITIGADYNWYKWSDAIGKIKTRLRNPNTSAPASSIESTTDVAGKDNASQSLAIIYKVNDKSTLYSGLSHTENVMESRGLSPITGYVAQWHISAGYKHKFTESLNGMLSYTYLPWNTREYKNKQLPLGETGKEQFEYYSLVFSIDYNY